MLAWSFDTQSLAELGRAAGIQLGRPWLWRATAAGPASRKASRKGQHAEVGHREPKKHRAQLAGNGPAPDRAAAAGRPSSTQFVERLKAQEFRPPNPVRPSSGLPRAARVRSTCLPAALARVNRINVALPAIRITRRKNDSPLPIGQFTGQQVSPSSLFEISSDQLQGLNAPGPGPILLNEGDKIGTRPSGTPSNSLRVWGSSLWRRLRASPVIGAARVR